MRVLTYDGTTKSLLVLLFVLLLTIACPSYPQAPNNTSFNNCELRNGHWFDGRTFRERTFYIVDGRLTSRRPRQIDKVIDLNSGFVVPPFGDAHCHHFDANYSIDQQVGMYLRDGVFYAAVQTDVRSGALQVANKLNQPNSVDVAYAHGALTSSFGHGVEIYEGLVLFRRPGAINAEEVKKLRESHVRENDAYYIIDTLDDLTRKWPTILAGRPDFIKIYLLISEEYEATIKRTDTVGDRGIDPKLVPVVVSKAHAAGLRVSAHVDTVTDYRVALRARVDEMAHLPGYYIGKDDDPLKYELTKADAQETAMRKISVIVAPVFYDMFNPQSQRYDAQATARTDAVRVRNLRLLRKYKVQLAFGSDRYGNTPVDDVLYLQRLGVFSNLEMLKIWCEATPHLIFPSRKIGYLKEGYEASFLVLDGNPIEDFSKIKSVRLRVKQGVPIKLRI
jgi:imidazolonepropionase-like amidohydrolase